VGACHVHEWYFINKCIGRERKREREREREREGGERERERVSDERRR